MKINLESKTLASFDLSKLLVSLSMIYLRVIYNSSSLTKENHGRDRGLVMSSLLVMISTMQFRRISLSFFFFYNKMYL